MAFRSLRGRLLVVQSALVVGMTALTLAVVSVLANRAVGDRISEDLARSRVTIVAAEAERQSRLSLVAQLVASFPELRGLFATDAATIRDFLSDYRQRHGRDELLIALDANGQVVARSDTFAPLTIADATRTWVEPALTGRPAGGVLLVEGRPYQAAIAAAEAGGSVFGFVLAAAPIDDGWATALRTASEKEIVILTRDGVAGSTLPAGTLPWRGVADLEAPAEGAGAPLDVTINGERFLAAVVPAPADSPVRVVGLQSRDRALAVYRNIQIGLLAIGLVAAAGGVAGSAVFARSLTAPIGQLVEATRRVSAGSYDVALPVDRKDELGDLARSFNVMITGLRERADMEKFVSQSTVQMIQRQQPQAERRGARREVTLLFCDIRGFTEFAQRHEPEEAVRVLNRYLHLQADLVRRFRGDVDKFMGDAVFANFMGPDMALDAIRCGMEIQRAVAGASSTDPTLPVLAVGVGIATGEVILGSIGSEDRLDYTAIGPAVNLASRLCSAAQAHEILISESTFSLVKDLVAAEPVPPLAVKGISEPVRAYRMRLKGT